MLSLKPLAMVFISGVLVNLTMFKIGGSPLSRFIHNPSTDTESASTKPKWWLRLMVVIILLGPIVAFALWLPSAMHLVALTAGGLLTILISLQIEKNTNLTLYIPNPTIRHFLIFMVTGSTWISVYTGFQEAKNLRAGRFYLAVSDHPCAERLIGKAGDFIFYYIPSNGATRYVNNASFKSITVYKKNNGMCDASLPSPILNNDK